MRKIINAERKGRMKVSHGFTLKTNKQKKELRTDMGGMQKGYKKRVIFNLEGVKRYLELEDRVHFKSPDLDRLHTKIAKLGVIKK